MLFRDRLLIALAASECALVRIRKGLRPRVMVKRGAPCDPAYGAESWHGAAAGLRTLLDGAGHDHLDATVVLSNHFVRYALLPWSDALGDEDEEVAYARHYFSKIYGDRAKSWVLRVADAPAGAPRLASAIDAALVDAIRGCFPDNSRIRLVSLQPYLMAAFNCWRGSIPREGAWLVLAEEERTCVALHAAGRWRSIRNARGTLGSPEDWAALLDRERHQIGGDVPDLVLVRTARGTPLAPRRAGRWKFQDLALPALAGFLPVQDGRYAIALAAQ